MIDFASKGLYTVCKERMFGKRKWKGGENNDMRKTIYLNFDLDKPEELLYYNFLENLGRAKKSVVIMALKNTQLLQNYLVTNNMALLAMQGMVLPESKTRKTGHRKFGKFSSAEKDEIKVVEALEPVVKAEEVVSIYADTEVVENTLFDTIEEEPETIFTEEQLIKIQEKGLDLDALSDNQKKAMAKMMAEQFMSATTAYSLAGFEK